MAAMTLAGCSSSEPSAGAGEGEGAHPTALANVDLANTRTAPSAIDSASVGDLELAWSLPQRTKGPYLRYIASPVVKDGIVFLQDPSSNVEAVDLDSGELLWERRFEDPVSGPNGVIVIGRVVYGATRTRAIALDAETGEELWSTPIVGDGTEQIAMAPGYHDGRVYLSTATFAGEGDEVGVLWALDARTGRKLWHFDTVPRGLWGNPEINYGGGIDFTPAFDGEGSMFIGVSGPGPVPGTARYPWGSSRPGPNLYSNSIVKLDERSGEIEWFHQVTPHAVCAGGFGPPVLARAGGRKIVTAVGLGGIAVALDSASGELLWRHPLGIHNGHDHDGLLAMRGEAERLKLPLVSYPGIYGGVFGPISLRGSTAYIAVNNGAVRVTSQESLEAVGSYRSELIALNVGTGKIEWKHDLPDPILGPTTVTNDLVLASSLGGDVFALDADSGERVWGAKLPDHSEGGMAVVGKDLLVRSGSFGLYGEMPRLVAYRLGE
ncbi:MAG TPA: PQQ-binding-like beta-propeller repeat protein [Solirubrobacterales bacterium]|nr:PQQ-binding-like beta-propeller repeat protein [Solirubrobacterales bacterium]